MAIRTQKRSAMDFQVAHNYESVLLKTHHFCFFDQSEVSPIWCIQNFNGLTRGLGVMPAEVIKESNRRIHLSQR